MQKIVVRDECADVQLVPQASILVAVGGTKPGSLALRFRGLHRLHVLQPEHATDHEAAERVEALGDQQQPAIGSAHRGLPSREGGEIHYARALLGCSPGPDTRTW